MLRKDYFLIKKHLTLERKMEKYFLIMKLQNIVLAFFVVNLISQFV